jgi:predicted nucleotidyltransferase
MLTKEIILEKLRALKPGLRDKFGITDLALFGSYARGEQTAGSDLDIMIQLNEPSFRAYSQACEVIDRAFPGVRVQSVSKAGIKTAYFDRIKKDLIYA